MRLSRSAERSKRIFTQRGRKGKMVTYRFSLLKAGRSFSCSAALSQKAALQMLFFSTTPPVKMGYRNARRRSDIPKFKIILPLNMARVQRRRPPPAAETGRSCWGSGQQDARAAQGTMRMLGAATRKKRKPFQIVLLPNPHPVCKLNLHLFCVLRRFSAILRGCKKLCGFYLTGGCLRVIMNT